MHYFLKIFFPFSKALIRKTKFIVMMTKEGSTKIVIFMIPARAWPYKVYSENALFL